MKEIKISDNLSMEENETHCVELTVPSLVHESPEKIREEVKKFNEKVNYFLEKGQDCQFITAEKNNPFNYEDLLFLEEMSDKIKMKIQKENFQNNIEKARAIEYAIFSIFTPISWNDQNFGNLCTSNLVQAIKVHRGSCCHYAALTQYLHLRNGIYSDIIYSRTNKTIIDQKENIKIEYYHMFNLLFIGENSKKWTCLDSMWESDFFRNRYSNEFSFVDFDQMRNSAFDYNEAHKHTVPKIDEFSTITINLLTVDIKLGALKKLYYLYPTCVFMAQDIFEGNFEKAIQDFDFEKEDRTICNLRNRAPLIQIIGMLAYVCSIELGNKGLRNNEKREEENVLIKHLDTYLEFIISQIYGGLYWERIKNNNSIVITDEETIQMEDLNSLFDIITDKDGNLLICFDDNIDKFCLYMDFNQKDLPIIEVLESLESKNFITKGIH